MNLRKRNGLGGRKIVPVIDLTGEKSIEPVNIESVEDEDGGSSVSVEDEDGGSSMSVENSKELSFRDAVVQIIDRFQRSVIRTYFTHLIGDVNCTF